MAPAEWILSVDFGTSNTAAAHSAAVSGAIESLALSHAGNLMSSGVFVDAPDRIAVGDHAVNEAQRNPAAFIPAPKRLVGQESIAVNGHLIGTSLPIGAVLRTVFSRAAAAHAGRMPSHLVLTHPEAWSPAQVRVLLDAAGWAGMNPSAITTISEPRAAAAHYARGTDLAVGATIAVFDFGGGTLDVAVLVRDADGGFSVIAARGDNGLGGKNFDALIRRWVDHQLEARNPDLAHYLRRTAPAGVRHQLDESIRRAKELLSEAPSATITAAGGGFHETLQITRDEFDELIAAPLDAAAALTRAVLHDAGIRSRDQLTALYLTGGTSRIPLVQRTLQTLGPVATLDDPKTVVAQGALAAVISDRPRQAVLPDAADLMSQWKSVPTGPTAAISTDTARAEATPGSGRIAAVDASSPRRGRRAVLAGGALVVVAAVVAVVVVLTSGGSDNPAPNPSADSTGSVSMTGLRATTPEEIVARLPQKLAGALTGCEQSNDGPSGIPQIICAISTDSGLVTGLLTTSARITVSADRTQARTDVVRIRRGDTGGTGTVVENTARTAAAGIQQSPGSTAEITYASSSSYIRAFVTGVVGTNEAKTFLTRSELIS
ncbi:Hsp70 family protein [Williamsia sp. M5A3_1d]